MIGAWFHARNMREMFARFGRHDLEGFSRGWAEDIAFVYPGPTSWAGRFEGKQAMKAWIRRYMDFFPRIEFAVKSVCVERPLGLATNVVTTEWEVSVTDRKGNDFAYGGVTVIRVERAKAVAATDYILDTSVLARALGEEGGAQARAS